MTSPSQREYFTASIALILLFIIPLCNVMAEEGSVNLRFWNSANGYAAHPDEILLRHKETGATMRLSSTQVAGIVHSGLTLERGLWEATVFGRSFQSLSTRIAVGNHSTIEFFLDPLSAPVELQPASIERLRTADATVVLGFVADDETGIPLEGISIRQAEGNSMVRSDHRGFYKISLPSSSGNANVEFSIPGFQSIVKKNIELWPNGDWICNIRLKRGTGVRVIDESKANRQHSELNQLDCPDCSNKDRDVDNSDNLMNVLLPASIRVGRNCTGTSCTTVQVYSLETYCKYVLPAEWYSCWGSLANGMNSLQAGAVAIRSYGLWYVYHPLSSTYDICDNKSCQVFGSSQSSNANNAVDATARYILTDFAIANVMRSEYSAENNNKGCGDGWTGTGTTWPCISDQVCLGQTPNGHGRGVCQWGTVRWANGTRVTTASPCSQGTSHGLGTKTWQEILSHYYPSYTLVQGGTAAIQSATPNPTSVAQGSTFSIEYTINTTDDMLLILEAAIAPTGTTSWVYDRPHDVKLSFFSGTSTVSRSFTVPSAQATGSYDLSVAVWHDKNNSNTIDAGDFVVHSRQYTSAITITVLPVQLSSFTATVVNGNDVRLDWRTASEINNLGFYVQRRLSSAQTYEEIPNSFVPGNGTTNIPHDYTFTNINVGNGSWFYRLRQVDLDGTPHFTDPVQVSIVTSVAENAPAVFRLYQNYPNPFNPLTNFQFSIDNSQLTILKVFDILGKEVATLVNEPMSAGMHTVLWDATSFPTGVYTYRLISGSNTASKRLVLLR